MVTNVPDIEDAVDRGSPGSFPADADASDGRSVGREVAFLCKVGGVVDKDGALDRPKPHLVKHLVHC